MWLKGFAGFDECLETGQDARPAVRTRNVRAIILSPLVMRQRNLGGLAFRREFYGNAGDLAR